MDRPDLKAGSLMRDAIALLRAHPWPLVLPPLLLAIVTGGGREPRRMDAGGMPGLEGVIPFYAVLAFVGIALVVVALVIAIVVLILIVTALVWTATSAAMLDALRTGAAPSFGAAFDRTRPLMLPGAWTLFLAGLLVVLGFLALLVPGFFVLGAFLPLFAILADEGKTAGDALRASWERARGHKGQLALVVLAGIGVNIAVAIVVGWIPFLGPILAGIASGLVSAAWLAVGALFYHRTRAAPAPVVASDVAPPPMPGP